MEKIKVAKQELIEKLKENRALHKEEYEKAVLGYKINVKKAFRERLKELKNLPELELGEFNTYFNKLYKPDSHDNEFKLAIGMLELSVDEFVEITAEEYQQYYLNEWSWKQSWGLTHFTNCKAGADAYATLYNVAGVGDAVSKSTKK